MKTSRVLSLHPMAYERLKRVEVFKTNVSEEEHAHDILAMLLKQFPHYEMNFDLEDCDRILRIEGYSVKEEEVILLLSNYGYHCSLLA